MCKQQKGEKAMNTSNTFRRFYSRYASPVSATYGCGCDCEEIFEDKWVLPSSPWWDGDTSPPSVSPLYSLTDCSLHEVTYFLLL